MVFSGLTGAAIVFFAVLFLGTTAIASALGLGSIAVGSITSVLLATTVTLGVIWLTGFPKNVVSNRSKLAIPTVILLVITLLIGGSTLLPSNLIPTAQVTSQEQTMQADVIDLSLSNGCVVPPGASAGDTATVDLIARDFESNTQLSSTPSSDLVRTYLDGKYQQDISTSAGGNTINAAVGQKLSWFGGNGTSYVEPGSVCITSARQPVEIRVHNATSSVNDLQISCFDTDINALTAADNTSLGDYKFTMGASQTINFNCKQSVQAADTSFNIGAIVTAATNDINDVKLLSLRSSNRANNGAPTADQSSWTQVPVPSFLRNQQMAGGAGAGNTTVSFDHVYRLNDDLLLSEFEDVMWSFSAEATSTDPSATSQMSTDDQIIICTIDAVSQRDAFTGQEASAINTLDSSESNVGVAEDIDQPRGKQSCVVISPA